MFSRSSRFSSLLLMFISRKQYKIMVIENKVKLIQVWINKRKAKTLLLIPSRVSCSPFSIFPFFYCIFLLALHIRISIVLLLIVDYLVDHLISNYLHSTPKIFLMFSILHSPFLILDVCSFIIDRLQFKSFKVENSTLVISNSNLHEFNLNQSADHRLAIFFFPFKYLYGVWIVLKVESHAIVTALINYGLWIENI